MAMFECHITIWTSFSTLESHQKFMSGDVTCKEVCLKKNHLLQNGLEKEKTGDKNTR